MVEKKILDNLGVRPTSMSIYDIPIDLLEPVSWNPNEMNDATFNRLVEEISENGFLEPLQVVFGSIGRFKIVGGQHRWEAARVLGYDVVPCIIMDMPDDVQKLVNVRLNVIRGKFNPVKFVKLYEEASSKYGNDKLQHLFGFTNQDAFKRLISGAVDAAIDATGATGKKKEKLKKNMSKAKSIDSLGRILRDFFEKGGDDLSTGFMIFVHGGKTHVYVEMSDQLKGDVDKIISSCRTKDRNINDVLSDAISEAAKKL